MTAQLHEAKPWVRLCARAGYAAKGLLYATIGVLAAMAAVGTGGKTTGSKGAIRELHEQPFGQLLLVLVAVGLAGYALWRFVQSLLDPEQEGRGKGAKGVGKRIGWLAAGFVHAGLVVYTIGLLTGTALGGANRGEGENARAWTAQLMRWPGGPWLVGIAGLAAVAFGGHQLYRAYKAKLDDELDLTDMPPRGRRLAITTSRVGLAARGAVSALLGVALVFAAVRTDPSEAKSVGEALHSIQAMSFGWLLLGAVALGLVAYGVYQFIEARYRRICAT